MTCWKPSYEVRIVLISAHALVALVSMIMASLWLHTTGLVLSAASAVLLCFVIHRQSTRGRWDEFKGCRGARRNEKLEGVNFSGFPANLNSEEHQLTAEQEQEQEQEEDFVAGGDLEPLPPSTLARFVHVVAVVVSTWIAAITFFHLAGPDAVFSQFPPPCVQTNFCSNRAAVLAASQFFAGHRIKSSRVAGNLTEILRSDSRAAIQTSIKRWVTGQSGLTVIEEKQVAASSAANTLALSVSPAMLIEPTGYYIHARALSLLMGWPDDVVIEVFRLRGNSNSSNLESVASVMFVHSESRLKWGITDGGVNAGRGQALIDFL
mmetsp:Transcript_397/g.744  ORF Transcript_397/g.744 Transcript_397/m.744 type:complete len:321 (-) Transcript_397:41-1003(-)